MSEEKFRVKLSLLLQAKNQLKPMFCFQAQTEITKPLKATICLSKYTTENYPQKV